MPTASGDPVSILHRAFLEGSSLTNCQLEALCDLLGLDWSEGGTTKAALLKLIIESVFNDEVLRQKAMDACSKPRAVKRAVADDDVTKAVVEHLADDPENTDAVKEAKKEFAKKRIKDLEIVIKKKAKAKAKAKAKSKARAKAKPKARAKAKAKAKARTMVVPGAGNRSSPRKIFSERPKQEPTTIGTPKATPPPAVPPQPEQVEDPFWDIVSDEEIQEELFQSLLKCKEEPPGEEDASMEEVLNLFPPDPQGDDMPVPEAEEKVPALPPSPPLSPMTAEQQRLWDDLWKDEEPGDSSSSKGIERTTPQDEPAKKQYPAGVQKKHVRPDALKPLDCPGGSIGLDQLAHRFTASLTHTPKQESRLVPPYSQHGFSKVFGSGTGITWQESLRECHRWLWTKFPRLQPNAKKLQTPGDISETILSQLEETISSLGPKAAYGKKTPK